MSGAPVSQASPGSRGARRTVHRRGLFAKYVLSLVGLATLVLALNGAHNVWFAYGEAKQAALRVQQEKAQSAAQRIQQFVAEIERQIGWTTHAQWAAGSVEQRRFDYVRLLRQVPAITEIVQLDGTGREQLRVSRLAMDVVGSGQDWSQDPRYVEAAAKKIWISPVYFRKESEPYMSLAVARSGRNAGVTVAEVNLKLIWDVITAIRVGERGYAYVVDGRGRLIAHPDISLVLRKTDFSRLSQVASAIGPGDRDGSETATITQNLDGRDVIAAHAPIAPLDWTVFVELPLAEALAPLVASAVRTGALLLFGLMIAGSVGLLLARRMVVPIRTLEAGAARLGAGDLGHRIAVTTGDELEALANGFNRMAAQLQESYAGLERKVEERTRELSEALEQQTATANLLRVISRSPGDVAPVFDAMLENATRICKAEFGWLWSFDGKLLTPTALSRGTPPALKELAARGPVEAAPGTLSGRTVIERRIVHIEDALHDPQYSWTEAQRAGGFRTMLGVPLFRDGMPIGVFSLMRARIEPFTEKQIALVATFADQAVIAIENARLLTELRARTEELARSIEELQTLRDIGQAVSSTLDLSTVLGTVVERAVSLARADAGAIYRYRQSERVFRLDTSYGFGEELARRIRGARIREEETTALGRAVRDRLPVQVQDLAATPSLPLRDLSVAAGFRAVLMVPLVSADRVIGVLAIQKKTLGEFPEETVKLMQTFASQSVLAIQNARLFREVEEQGRELAVASQHKSQFLANMSHELRTPMNAVLGYAELLLDGIYGELPAKAKGVLERVQANGKHLLGLINDVLDLSKIEAGQLTLSVDDYSMRAIVQQVVSATESLARNKGLMLTASISEGLPLGRGDERRLTQVLLNLVGNAIKFTDAGEVAIAAGMEDGCFSVAVRDTGPGITAADQERIFDEFQQVDNTSTRKKGGTGLGLAISKRIVEMHGGALTVESIPGEGSTFRIVVPVRVAEKKEAAE